MNDLDRNQDVADSICRDFAWQGRVFQPGDCVALRDGVVIAVAPDADQALPLIRKIDPNHRRGMLVEVGKPVVDVIR